MSASRDVCMGCWSERADVAHAVVVSTRGWVCDGCVDCLAELVAELRRAPVAAALTAGPRDADGAPC